MYGQEFIALWVGTDLCLDSARNWPSTKLSDNTIEQSLLSHTNGMLLLIFAGGFCPEE